MRISIICKYVFKYLLLGINMIMCAFVVFIIAFNCLNIKKIGYNKVNEELHAFSE
ncbi:hypothetical protein OTSGILL_0397 [Orientia tsutsugamushi str. Gilliam]|uniref:Uncharacterized protein n=1 Tax=Orientia tsutsugamushi str. Gilliam TaxID=1359184 RepID=A0A0F3MH48_ORITS|nr:hypothetical protein OTSGILL_0397 [Orientia tsutsugamushi str. Gilliam]KJV55178.1 hypothetical protein OTSKATO_0751 [Orientia tsutsugamushi str. Kato PP]SPR08149.1 Uncharacterised protein [Orientia tsutsugamushi str. Gilliam]